MTKQITDTLLMVRPVAFGKNDQTAVNNYYQKSLTLDEEEIQSRALKEFDEFVKKLRNEGVKVIVVEDTADPPKPDSIFPNNWVSFHEDGTIWLYPMFAENRRMERRDDILDMISKEFEISGIDSLTDWEKENKYLEGTGSLILDRPNKIGYAAISQRTNPEILDDFEDKTGFEVVRFNSFQTVNNKRMPIYHTNVMMFVGEKAAVICSDSIDDPGERQNVLTKLRETGKEIVEITEEQTERFAGNMLQVSANTGKKLIVMSQSAYNCLDKKQIDTLSRHGKIVYSDLTTIETLGGGSARCMMAEIFLPKKS